jgi:hypothetical protein
MESLGPRVYSFEKGLSYETRPNGLVVKKNTCTVFKTIPLAETLAG